jgi:hydroxyacylglutathione hydrolase
VLIADSVEQVSEARMRLARVGIENVRGYLRDGIAGWKNAGFEVAQLRQVTVDQLHERLTTDGIRVLDVRRQPEWTEGHIADATWWPLDNFKVSPPSIDPDIPVAVHCKSGYRSIIACSLLQRAGFNNVVDVVGGFDAWQNAKLPIALTAAATVSK